MSDDRPKSIEHIFRNKFYDRVEARKDKLLEKLEKAIQYNDKPELPLTAVHEIDHRAEVALTQLNSLKPQKISFFSDDPPSISFDIKQGQTITCDYLCVEYFRPYLISDDKTSFQRYKYFEFYYDEYILSCLIDVPTFQKEGSFIPAEMDRREWSHAKLQMKLWNSVLAPEIEEIDIKSSDKLLSPALEERFLKYAKQHFKKSISHPYPNSNRLE